MSSLDEVISTIQTQTEGADRNGVAAEENYERELATEETDGGELATEETDGGELASEETDGGELATEEDETLMNNSSHEALVPVPSDDLPTDCMIVDGENMEIVQNDESVLDKKSAVSLSKTSNKKAETYSRICDYCSPPRTFRRQLVFILHQLDHVQTSKEKCDICEMEFVLPSDLLKHMEIHNPPKTYACSECSSKFKTPERLQLHEKVHSKEKKYFCDQCSYKTYRLDNLQNHSIKHTREKKYFCKQCPFTTHRPYGLGQHVKRQHGKANKRGHKMDITEFVDDIEILKNSDMKFKCKICGKQFPVKYKIMTHVRRHKDVKPYSCDICSYTSVTVESLKLHKTTHSDERNYPCTLCPYKAKNMGMLYHHKKRKHRPVNQSQ